MPNRLLLTAATLLCLGFAGEASASQCPPFGVACAGSNGPCKGEIGGYCCCKPSCYMYKNTVVCSCNQFCPAQCGQFCPGQDACEKGACYYLPGGGAVVPGGTAEHDPEGKFRMSADALQHSREQDYGGLATLALGAFTKDFTYAIPNGTWTSSGVVTSNALPERFQRPSRDVKFKVTWVGADDHVIGSFVFSGRRAPPPVAVRVDLDGGITVDGLDRAAARAVVKAVESAPCPKAAPAPN